MLARLESFSKVIAGAVLLVYAAGFTVLSLHDASHGIMHFDVLRSKAMAAGFVFCLLIILPASAMIYGYDEVIGIPPPQTDATKKVLRNLIALAAFCFTGLVLSNFAGFLFEYQAPQNPWWFGVASLLGIAFFVLAFRLVSKRFETKPIASTILAGVAAAALISCLQQFGTDVSGQITLWFLGVGSMIFSLTDIDGKFDTREILRFRTWFIASLLLSFYSVSIYHRIKPQFGGGAPLKVELILAADVLGIGKTVSASLVDETDSAFLVEIRGNGDKPVPVYLPKAKVEAVIYSAGSIIK